MLLMCAIVGLGFQRESFAAAVVINEVNTASSGGFVELYNRGTSSQSLAGWWLSIGDAKQSLSGVLAPGEFVNYYLSSSGGRYVYHVRDNVGLFDDLGVLVCQIG